MDTLAPFRKYFRMAALACSCASAILTGIFAWHQGEWWLISVACVLFLVAVSFASDYINLFIVDAWRAGNRAMVAMLCAGAAVVFTLNLISNLGSVGWQRDSVIKAAKVQNTKFEDARDQVSEGKASLEMWKARLAKLESENAWAATVTADGLRAQLDSSQKAIDLEAARGGCKTKCLLLMEKKADLERRISVAEETGTLRKKIEATKAVLAKYREKAAGTEAVVAAPDSQAKFFASMVSLDLAPSEDAQTWTNRGVATWLAVGLCIAPMLFGLIGWKTSHDDDDTSSASAPVEPTKADVAPLNPIRPATVRHSLNTQTIAQLRELAA